MAETGDDLTTTMNKLGWSVPIIAEYSIVKNLLESKDLFAMMKGVYPINCTDEFYDILGLECDIEKRIKLTQELDEKDQYFGTNLIECRNNYNCRSSLCP
jgi:hypothetical protein